MTLHSCSRESRPADADAPSADAYVRHVLDPAAVCDGACPCLVPEPDPMLARLAMADALADILADSLVSAGDVVGSTAGASAPAREPMTWSVTPTGRAQPVRPARRETAPAAARDADDRKEAA